MLTEKEPILKLEKICKGFSGVPVLQDVSLCVYPGEVHCLMGENGAGKSTLIKIISGSYTADSGSIRYLDTVYKKYNPRWAHENGINTIYQEIDLVPHLTVAENISLRNEPLTRSKNIDDKKIKERAISIFKDMGVSIDVNTELQSLKVASQQLVAIAKALSLNSKVLILDEPTSVFTNTEVELLFGLIRKLKEQGIAIVYISHHLDEIFEIGDRITVLKDGCLVRTGLVSEFDKDSLVKSMVGRDVKIDKKERHTSIGEEVLSLYNLTRKGVVKGVSLKVHRGEILGIGGLVGAGRTELIRLIIGADQVDEGVICYKGNPVKINSPKKALKMGIGLVPEDRKGEGIVAARSVLENMSYSTIEKTSKASIIKWKAMRKRGLDLFADLNVQPKNPYKSIQYLSGGNQQKAVLGKLLNADCELLLLDEPTRGVDVGAREEIYKVITKLKEKGTAILMVSSDLIELLSQSDRIAVMANGTIVKEFERDEATEERILEAALNLGGA